MGEYSVQEFIGCFQPLKRGLHIIYQSQTAWVVHSDLMAAISVFLFQNLFLPDKSNVFLRQFFFPASFYVSRVRCLFNQGPPFVQ